MARKIRRRRTVKPGETAQLNTTGGVVRISHPKSTRNKPSARETAAVVVDVVTPKAVEGFFGFLREHAVVGLAVGLVIGTQLKAIVDSLNSGFINPLFGLLFNGDSLTKQTATTHWHGRMAELQWGALVYQVIDFIFVMAVIYALIKILHLDRLDQPKKK